MNDIFSRRTNFFVCKAVLCIYNRGQWMVGS